jgi:hypothetical protein
LPPADRFSRRTFNKKMLSSLAAYGLIETLFTRQLLGDTVKPLIHQWLADLNALSQDVKGQKLKDVEFQTKLEELYKRVDLPDHPQGARPSRRQLDPAR